ncbi:unnamed protein product [Amoebophrya sp. A25]|nr:unnamed protein product [Amoebophrya sp. A25]|eukprot:GSA25T00017730001.1
MILIFTIAPTLLLFDTTISISVLKCHLIRRQGSSVP